MSTAPRRGTRRQARHRMRSSRPDRARLPQGLRSYYDWANSFAPPRPCTHTHAHRSHTHAHADTDKHTNTRTRTRTQTNTTLTLTHAHGSTSPPSDAAIPRGKVLATPSKTHEHSEHSRARSRLGGNSYKRENTLARLCSLLLEKSPWWTRQGEPRHGHADSTRQIEGRGGGMLWRHG